MKIQIPTLLDTIRKQEQEAVLQELELMSLDRLGDAHFEFLEITRVYRRDNCLDDES